MRKHIKKILIASGAGILLVFIAIIYSPWVILPTKSSPHKLTLVHYGYLSANRITLSHYVNGVHINEYVLDLKIGLRHQKPQTYELPQLKEGMVEVTVVLEDEMQSSVTLSYGKTRDFYRNGLLIYLTHKSGTYDIVDGEAVYDRYVYFISGKEKKCYFREALSPEWSLITDAPPPKMFTREDLGYNVYYYGWKENEWVVVDIEHST